jgi:hypothetical protein
MMLRITQLLESIGEHQAGVSFFLFSAAGVIGVVNGLICAPDLGPEIMNLANNIARHGTFANPFGSMPTGPTAANPPLYPFLVAGVVKLLRAPNLVYGALFGGSMLANAITAALLPRVSLVLYRNVIPGVIASALWLSAMPVIPGWDTSYTVLGLLFLCVLTASTAGPSHSSQKVAGRAGILCGFLFLLNPSSLLIVLPWIGFLLWRGKANLRRSARSCGTMVMILFMFVAAWGGRNYYQLGAFVVRTQLGIALFVSNNDCAQSSILRDQLNGCYQSHHPNVNVHEAELLRASGEVQYDRKRIADTKRWIRSNPAKFFEFTAARIHEFWFPAREVLPTDIVFSDAFRRWVNQQNRVAYAIWIITALSVPGLILMTRRREPLTLFVLTVLAIYPLMYYVVVSDMRYRYPVLWLSLLPAGYFVGAALAKPAAKAPAREQAADAMCRVG